MTNQAPKTLYTKSFFSSKEYNLSKTDQLKISEATAVSAKSQSIPLDLIETKPLTEEKINPQLIGFTLTCALASGIFYLTYLSTSLTVAGIFSGIFFLATLGALYMTSKLKLRSYTYHYANTTTPLFTLKTSQSDEKETSQFIENLSGLIKATSIEEEDIMNFDLPSDMDNPTNDQEQEYLTYTYHLDYLYASGLVDEDNYQKISQNIADMVFNEAEKYDSNVIQFPSKN